MYAFTFEQQLKKKFPPSQVKKNANKTELWTTESWLLSNVWWLQYMAVYRKFSAKDFRDYFCVCVQTLSLNVKSQNIINPGYKY